MGWEVVYTPLSGEELFRLRNEALLSEEDVEKITGIPVKSLKKYEKGIRRPDFDRLRQLLMVYGREKKRWQAYIVKARKLSRRTRKIRIASIRQVLHNFDIALAEKDWVLCMKWIEQQKRFEIEAIRDAATEEFRKRVGDRKITRNAEKRKEIRERHAE